MRLRNEVTSRPWAIMERIGEHTLQVSHRGLCSINRKRLAAAQIAKPAAIVQSHNVIGMRMGEENRVQPADVFAQHMDAKFRGCVQDEPSLVGIAVNGGTGTLVFGIIVGYRG